MQNIKHLDILPVRNMCKKKLIKKITKYDRQIETLQITVEAHIFTGLKFLLK